MGFALIAGVSPVYGLYAAFIATIVGTLTSSSTFMTIAPTNALALVVFSTLGNSGEVSIEKMVTLTVLVGIFQFAFGLLRLGDLTRYVSNAVMTGFITGAGTLIVLGQLAHLTGYEAEGVISWSPQLSTAIPRFWDWLIHLPQSHPHTLVMGITATIIIAVLHHTRYKTIATLVAIIITSVFVLVAGWADVPTVEHVPLGLPQLALPQLAHMPELTSGALAMAVLALVQGAALTQTVREPDGTTADTNRDFIGQGLANIVGGFFQGLPSGGSLSRTAVNISAGARTRMANLLAGGMIGLMLIAFGAVIEYVTLAALAGHLVVAAVSLIRIREIRFVWNVNLAARLAMVATFLSTLLLPLEYSIYVGVALSMILFIYSSSHNVKVVRLIPLGDHRFREEAPPKVLPTNSTVIISVHGHLYFAAIQQLEQDLPEIPENAGTVVILRLRNNRYMGSTGIHLLERYAQKLRANGGRLMMTGISNDVFSQLKRTHAIEFFGEENLFPQCEVVFEATEKAMQIATDWLNQKPAPTIS